MRSSRRIAGILAVAVLIGCTPADYVRDSDPIDSAVGYVLIRPDYHGPRKAMYEYELALDLQRVEEANLREIAYFPKIRNHHPTIIRLPPGVYYLRQLGAEGIGPRLADPWSERFRPSLTLFEVRAGQLNYAGDWVVSTICLDGEVMKTITNSEIDRGACTRGEHVEDNPATHQAAKRGYPMITDHLELRFTKISVMTGTHLD
jgi:hypothetical protein